MRLRSLRPPRLLRGIAAVLGTAAWAYWWAASSHLSPKASALAWVAALVLWAVALFSTWRLPKPSWSTALAAVIITALALPRSLSLSTAPYHVPLDEVIDAFYGLQVLRDHPWEIMSGASWLFGHPYLTQALLAWPCLFLQPLFGARLASLFLGLASLVSTYALAGRMFGKRTGVIAVAVLACSYWHIAYSRMAYPYMQPILMLPLVLHVLLFGVEERSRFLQFIGGMLLAASLLVYVPARIVIPIFVGWLIHRFVVRALTLKQAATAGAVIMLGATMFLGPYVHAQGYVGIYGRFRDVTVGGAGPLRMLISNGLTSPATLQLFVTQISAAARVYWAGGAWMAVSDWAPGPLLDPTFLILVLMGLLIAAADLRDSNRFLLLIWIAGTFVFGQVFTDVPISAYRAAPLLPALAICAGLGASAVARVLERSLRPLRHSYAQIFGMLGLVGLVLPPNLIALDAYMVARSRDPWAGMARLIATGPTSPVYYVVARGPFADQVEVQFQTIGRTVRDLANLMDSLGTDIDPSRNAVFVLEPGMSVAAAAIRRCYPAAIPITGPYPPGPHPVLAWLVSQPAIAAGRNCAVAPEGPGLRARYFRGENWDGELRRERVEDWPVHWNTTEEAAHVGSIEWSGMLRIPVPGQYRFQFLTNGAQGSAVVGDQLQIEPQENAGARFERDQYRVRLRCKTRPGALCWLRWAAPGGDFDAIPSELFSPDERDHGAPDRRVPG